LKAHTNVLPKTTIPQSSLWEFFFSAFSNQKKKKKKKKNTKTLKTTLRLAFISHVQVNDALFSTFLNTSM